VHIDAGRQATDRCIQLHTTAENCTQAGRQLQTDAHRQAYRCRQAADTCTSADQTKMIDTLKNMHENTSSIGGGLASLADAVGELARK